MFLDKYILALKCLKAALELDPESPKVHEQVIAFQHALSTASDLHPKVLEVIKLEFDVIEPSTNLSKYNDKFLAAKKDSARHALSAIKAKRIIGQDKATKLEEELLGLLNLPDITFTDAIEILETLKQWKSSQVDAFKKAAQAKWPEVTRLA